MPYCAVVSLGLFQVGCRLGFGGQRGFVTCLRLIDRRDIDIRVDFHQQIALFDLLAFFTGSAVISPLTSGLMVTCITG